MDLRKLIGKDFNKKNEVKDYYTVEDQAKAMDMEESVIRPIEGAKVSVFPSHLIGVDLSDEEDDIDPGDCYSVPVYDVSRNNVGEAVVTPKGKVVSIAYNAAGIALFNETEHVVTFSIKGVGDNG